MHKDDVQNFKNSFLNIGIKPIIKLGLETFDYDLREKVLVKGIEEKNPEDVYKRQSITSRRYAIPSKRKTTWYRT